jgi:hypothetical protein
MRVDADAPVAQLAEANLLKGFECRFESDRGHLRLDEPDDDSDIV